jgi:O-acetylhomoserine/O-acetylserine sulfhydrylase-like pyridoxal-dependent enzyme
VLEKRIAALEGGVAALATASGAAAISYTIQALAQAGSHIVAQKTIYGGSYNLLAHTLPQFGVETTFVDAAGPVSFVTYIRAILLRDTGAAISPFNAFLLLQGVETLSLRVERHAENTEKVVEYLAAHPQVEKVNHPSRPDHPDHALYEKYFPNGGASIFTFEIKGGQAEAHKFIDNLCAGVTLFAG